jgi:hypothetical protein
MEQEEHGEEVAELKRKASKAVEGKRKAVASKQEEKRRRLAAEVALEERENGVKVWTRAVNSNPDFVRKQAQKEKSR